MNNRWGLLLIACCNACAANSPSPSIEIPAILKGSLAPGEQVISLVRYSDSHGDHTLMLTERETAARSGAGRTVNLAATSFDKNGTREWVVRDGAECPAGSGAKPTFFPNTAPATDLNKDGTAEVTVAYGLSCGTGLEPAELKVILRQGAEKCAIRGQALVYAPGQPVRGGTRKPDTALLLPENAAFLSHLASMWNRVSRHFAGENAPPTPLQALEGNYTLKESIREWGYSKAHVSIRKLDGRHVVILLACEWKHSPKSACDDYFFAQWRDDGIYIQDVNTAVTRIYFKPAAREVAVGMVSVDGKTIYGLDVFTRTSGEPADPTLARRLKRAEQGSVHPESLRINGPYDKWKYEKNRIEVLTTTP